MPAEVSHAEGVACGAAPCPRCGYDLRGLAEAWTTRCPLKGVCTECGYDLEWADVLNENYRPPRWCIEYAQSRWDIARRVVMTPGMMLWPPAFWRGLKMSNPPHWRRIAIVLIIIPIVAWILFAITVATDAGLKWKEAAGAPELVRLVSTNGRQTEFREYTNKRKLWRVVVYAAALPLSETPGGELTPGAPIPRAQLTQQPQWMAQTVYTHRDDTGAIVPAARFLYSPREVAHGVFIGETDPVYAWRDWPRWIHPYLNVVQSASWLLGYVVVLYTIAPLCFALLPQSRRKARVLPRHIVRIWLYSLGFLLIPVVAFFVGAFLSRVLGEIADTSFQREFMLVNMMIMPAILFLWWGSATWKHLKMDHAWGVAFAMWAIAMLLTPFLGFFPLFTRWWFPVF